jgi:hypothetical protein
MDLRGIGWEGGVGVDSVASGYGPLAGFCEHGDEPSGYGTPELVTHNATAGCLILGSGCFLPHCFELSLLG